MLIWFWVIFTLIFVGINELMIRGIIPNEEIRDNGSIWIGASFSPRIFLLVLGILLTIGSFNSFVSHGITRRSFGRGGLIFVASMSFICAVINSLGYPIERIVIELSGAERVLEHPNLVVEGLINLMMYFGYFCVGWLIGTGYYRFHWIKGTLMCLLATAAVIGMEIVVSTDMLSSAAADTALKLLLLAVVSAIVIWTNQLFMRKLAVRRKITI